MIDWHSEQTEVLLNPRMPNSQKSELESIKQYSRQFPGHIWLCTSGSTSLKLVALSKEAILTSANAVNSHLDSTPGDIWLNPLPIFHVGGLGIIARAHLSNARLISYSDPWNPITFHKALCNTSSTLTALVPTQLYDLIETNLSPPPSLRAAIIGGGSLSPSLLQQASQLGWHILPSYGMTETASQIATATLNSSDINPILQILPHMHVRTNLEGKICIQSKSLLTAYAYKKKDGIWEIFDPKTNHTLMTEDLGIVSDNTLKIIGRSSDFIKIGGESVHLLRLEQILEEIKLKHEIKGDLALVSMPHERLGHVIHLAAAGIPQEICSLLINSFNNKIMPFERIRKVHYLDEIPRSALGKLLKNELLNAVIQNSQ